MLRYFDHEGEACSLRALMTTNDAALLQQRLDHGSPSPAPRGAKPGRYKRATSHQGFYKTFVAYLKDFFTKVRFLKDKKAEAFRGAAGQADERFKQVFFYRHANLSIDSTAATPEESKVWLGLGKEETIHSAGAAICKPVAIKSPRRSDIDPDILARVMAQMKPGSFIASAHETRVHVHGLREGQRLEDASPVNHSAAAAAPFAARDDAALGSQLYWVSEAGVCTLHELFEFPVPAEEERSAFEERSTQAHRRLVKEVCGRAACMLLGLLSSAASGSVFFVTRRCL